MPPRLQRRPHLVQHPGQPLLFHLIPRRHFPTLHPLPRKPLHPLQPVQLTPADQRQRHALPPGPTRPPNPVHVILRVIRQIKIHHQIQIIHVNPPPGHIRRHQQVKPTALELRQRPRPHHLTQSAMQPVRRIPTRNQRVRHVIHRPLRVAENNPKARIMHVHQSRQRIQLRTRRYIIINLLHRRHRHRLRLNPDMLRIRRKILNQSPNRRRQRRTEKHRLPLPRRP